jgi:hypothetical protein
MRRAFRTKNGRKTVANSRRNVMKNSIFQTKSRPRPSNDHLLLIGCAGPNACGCKGFGLTVRIRRVLHKPLRRVRHAHAGSEIGVTSQRLGGTRAAHFLLAQAPTNSPPGVKSWKCIPGSLGTLNYYFYISTGLAFLLWGE